ncbi:hypothetical protein DPEC_G00233450 [Dallia pectoralis]|uniref:Uncharacterized protein n=1 Tax=Dallia pectoralis TaxID=75939 RepID=A0ACC2FXM3_DALPE|nr:hypothetical protein DPEC_G00233450 [Dallia pectoralis]
MRSSGHVCLECCGHLETLLLKDPHGVLRAHGQRKKVLDKEKKASIDHDAGSQVSSHLTPETEHLKQQIITSPDSEGKKSEKPSLLQECSSGVLMKNRQPILSLRAKRNGVRISGMQAGAIGRPLFGGALSATIPHSAKDISELREIPDNQEVFAHCHTDQSIIVELLEFQSNVQNEDAARYHFEDVAGSNKASDPGTSEVRTVVALPKSQLSLEECSSAWLLTGTQCVAKFNEEAKNTVTIYLGLFRLPQFSTDVLVTFNDPLSISLNSSSAVGLGGDQQVGTEPWTLNNFQCLLKSVTLHDPGVFG